SWRRSRHRRRKRRSTMPRPTRINFREWVRFSGGCSPLTAAGPITRARRREATLKANAIESDAGPPREPAALPHNGFASKKFIAARLAAGSDIAKSRVQLAPIGLMPLFHQIRQKA